MAHRSWVHAVTRAQTSSMVHNRALIGEIDPGTCLPGGPSLFF